MPGLGLFLTGDEVPDEETTEQEEKAAEEGDVERPQGTQREAVAAVVDELVRLHEKDSAKFKPAVTKASLEKKASFNKVSYARTRTTHTNHQRRGDHTPHSSLSPTLTPSLQDGTLKHWDLQAQGLRLLPESFGGLVLSGYLLLNHNQLVALPASFGDLRVGRYLDLSDNQLMSLPDSFGDLKVGGSLSLAHNFLTTLPASMGRLRVHGDLSLFHNRLTALPEEFDSIYVQGELKLGNAQTLPAT